MNPQQHMLAGIACLEKGDWENALRHFDQAVQLRVATPWRTDPQAAWMLSAGWINHADALRFLNRPKQSIVSLDKAIAAMNHVSVSENAAYEDRLILAWINRATICGELARNSESLAGFAKAENLLAHPFHAGTPRRTMLESMLRANRARVLLDLGRAIGSWSDARKAVDLLNGLDPSPAVTEAAIRARGILCRALAMLLDEPCIGGLENDWIAHATDAAEEALALAHTSGCHDAWTADLVRYGAKIYRVCQPHFLGEFIREWTGAGTPLSANRALKREMHHELLLANADLEQRVRERPHDTEFVQREMETLASLQFAQKELCPDTF